MTKIDLVLPSGEPYDIAILESSTEMPRVGLPYTQPLVTDIPHIVAKLLEIHCAAIDAVVEATRAARKKKP